jgi:hypothetical protein
MWFEENFANIQHNHFAIYTGGEDEVPTQVSDFYDFSECTEQDVKSHCVEHLYEGNTLLALQDMTRNHDSWVDFLTDTLNEDGTIDTYLPPEEIRSIPKIKIVYEGMLMQGHCQGDYHRVLYRTDSHVAKLPPSDRDDIFEGYLYNAPVYCQINVDEKEYRLSDDLKNSYNYDTDELVELAEKTGMCEQAVEFLKANLPESPEYV